jgi:hypothetical protein
METFFITRKEMASLLLAMKNNGSVLDAMKELWIKRHQGKIREGYSWEAFLSTYLPPIFERIIQMKGTDKGLSLNEIVALGNQIEYTQISATSVQNWVKRDIKDHIGAPRIGRKYSVDQAAMLFIVEDIKTTLDFHSIRKLFSFVFNNPNDDSDDLISPVELFQLYSTIFEELDKDDNQIMDIGRSEIALLSQDHMLKYVVKRKADEAVAGRDLTSEQRMVLSNLISIAVLSVQSAYFHSLVRRIYNATLYLHDVEG